jgi:hypothetical protein
LLSRRKIAAHNEQFNRYVCVDTMAGIAHERRPGAGSPATGDLLAKLGRSMEARAEFERAFALTSNEAERAHLLARGGSA